MYYFKLKKCRCFVVRVFDGRLDIGSGEVIGREYLCCYVREGCGWFYCFFLEEGEGSGLKFWSKGF